MKNSLFIVCASIACVTLAFNLFEKVSRQIDIDGDYELEIACDKFTFYHNKYYHYLDDAITKTEKKSPNGNKEVVYILGDHDRHGFDGFGFMAETFETIEAYAIYYNKVMKEASIRYHNDQMDQDVAENFKQHDSQKRCKAYWDYRESTRNIMLNTMLNIIQHNHKKYSYWDFSPNKDNKGI